MHAMAVSSSTDGDTHCEMRLRLLRLCLWIEKAQYGRPSGCRSRQLAANFWAFLGRAVLKDVDDMIS